MDFAFAVMKTFGFREYVVELSDWDPAHPENYPGSAKTGATRTGALEKTLTKLGVPFKRMEGEGRFTARKSTSNLSTPLAARWQLTNRANSISILPGRFGLEYVGEDGNRHQPLMVHRALWGSVERFFGILIEHYAARSSVARARAGRNSSSQRKILCVRNKRYRGAACRGFRAHLDDRNEKLQAKIRDAQLQKIPYMLIVGGKEAGPGLSPSATRAGRPGPAPTR